MTVLRPELVTTLLDSAEIGVAVVDGDLCFHSVNDRLADMNGRPASEHIGRTIADVLPELAEVLEPLVVQVVETGTPLLAIGIEGSRNGDRDHHWEASYLPLTLESGDRGVAVVVMDVTDREAAVAEAGRRLRQQAALAELGQRALRAESVSEVLHAGVAMLAAELDSERAGVLELVGGDDHLLMRAGSGFPPGATGRMTAAAGPSSQGGYTLATGGPVITSDTHAEQRFTFTPELLELGVRSTVSVPIDGREGHFGVLGVLSSRVDHFDADDIALVQATANVLGATVVRAEQAVELEALAAQRGRLVAQALDAGDRERGQVADVLHDDVLQHLLFARLELASLDCDPAAKARVLASLQEAGDVLRRVIGGLHPVALAHAGLRAALESLAAERAERVGLSVEVDMDPRAEGRQDRLVVSLVRELLTNVVKHAGATRAAVRVGVDGEDVELEVADDGRGLPPDAFEVAPTRGNVGLVNARERVVALRGSIDVGVGLDGRGTRVSVRIPSA